MTRSRAAGETVSHFDGLSSVERRKSKAGVIPFSPAVRKKGNVVQVVDAGFHKVVELEGHQHNEMVGDPNSDFEKFLMERVGIEVPTEPAVSSKASVDKGEEADVDPKYETTGTAVIFPVEGRSRIAEGVDILVEGVPDDEDLEASDGMFASTSRLKANSFGSSEAYVVPNPNGDGFFVSVDDPDPPPDLAYCTLDPFKPTIFDSLPISFGERPDWSHLAGHPIHHTEVNELVHSFINIVDRRHGYQKSESRGKRCYGCKSKGCHWVVMFKRPTSVKSDYKEGAFIFHSKSPEHGPFCHGDLLITKKEVLQNLPDFAQFLFTHNGSDSLTRAQIESHLLSHNWDTRQCSKSSFYSALTELKAKIREYTAQEYSKLAQYLRRYIELNPSASAAYQDDDDGSFYRLFVSIPNGAKIHARCLQPLFIVDGGFPKTNEYDGVYIIFMGKTGGGANVLLSFAAIPDETCNHMSWVLSMLIRAGYDITAFPIYTDRGNVLSAARALKEEFGIEVSLKFCMEHICRNMVAKFKVKGEANIARLRSCVASIFGASYVTALSTSFNQLALSFDCGDEMAVYLLLIDPLHYSTCANKATTDQSEVLLWRKAALREHIASVDGTDAASISNEDIAALIDSPVPSGFPHPNWETTRTSSVESEMGAAARVDSWAGFRNFPPPIAVQAMLKKSGITLEKELNDNLMLDDVEDMAFTHIGIELSRRLRKSVPDFRVSSSGVDGEGRLWFIVTYVKDERRSYRVTLDGLNSICQCRVWNMMRFICPHIRRCMLHEEEAGRMDTDTHVLIHSYIHHTHFVSNTCHVLDEADSKIKLPPSTDFRDRMVSVFDVVQPPPRYKMTVNKSFKRFKSKGETGSGAHQGSPSKMKKKKAHRASDFRLTHRTKATQRRKTNKKMCDKLRNVAATKYFMIFASLDPVAAALAEKQLLALYPSGTRVLHCGECGSKFHTIRDCHLYLSFGRSYRAQRFIRGGRYLVYKPVCNRGIQNLLSRALYPKELFPLSGFSKAYQPQWQTHGGTQLLSHVNSTIAEIEEKNEDLRDIAEEIPNDVIGDVSEDGSNHVIGDVSGDDSNNDENDPDDSLFVQDTVFDEEDSKPAASVDDPEDSKPAAVGPEDCKPVGVDPEDSKAAVSPPDERTRRGARLLPIRVKGTSAIARVPMVPVVFADENALHRNETSNSSPIELLCDTDCIDDGTTATGNPFARLSIGGPVPPEATPEIQASVEDAVDVFSGYTMDHRIVFAERILDNALLRNEENEHLYAVAAAAYLVSAGTFVPRLPLMRVPVGSKFCGTDQRPGVSGTESIFGSTITRIVGGNLSIQSDWLDAAAMVSVESILNSRFYRTSYVFSTSHASVAFRSPGRDPKNGSLVFSKKAITRHTSLLLFPSHLEKCKLTSLHFWFFPWNRTGSHWTCYLLDLKKRNIIFFNAVHNPDEECLRPMKSISKQSTTAGIILKAVEHRFASEGVTFKMSEWCQWTFHPATQKIQQNDNHCGVYVILWIRALCRRPILDGNLDFTNDDAEFARHNLLHMLQCFSIPSAKQRE
jgi:hypothetical protein